MTIIRIEPGRRMSAAVVHGDTVYLAGHVSKEPAGSVRGQTETILRNIDARLAEAGTDRSKLLSASIWLTDIGTFGPWRRRLDASLWTYLQTPREAYASASSVSVTPLVLSVQRFVPPSSST